MWLLARLVFLTYWAYAGWTFESRPLHSPHWQNVFVIFWGAIGVRFWVMREYTKKGRTEAWLAPSWRVNPFLRAQPLLFFHLGGIAFVVFALSGLIRSRDTFDSGHIPDMPLFAGSFGLGILIGVYWAIWSHRARFVSPM